MEAHAGRIRVHTPKRAKPRRRARLLELLSELRSAQRDRAIRAHHGPRAHHVPGSEHTHMLRPRGF
jgi:hypothetical protein